MALDFLERKVLKAISNSSVYSYSTVKEVYMSSRSFDKTIQLLKEAVENCVDVKSLIH